MAKKHIKQMTAAEVAFAHGFIRQNVGKVWSSHSHFYDRAQERHFSLADARQTIAGGLVVEIHNDRQPEIRALVRSKSGTCVVLSLTTFEVITVYYNAPDDQHDTLNWNAYRWSQDVVGLVKSLRGCPA